MHSSKLRAGAHAMGLAVALAACAGCTASDRSPTGGTSSSEPSIVGAFGCGPTDARELRITGRGLPDRPVVAEVVFDGEVRNRSEARRGPDIEVTVMPDLPNEAYEPGAAEVRIVSGREVIVSAQVEPDLPICG